jgi:hypothetical protein
MTDLFYYRREITRKIKVEDAIDGNSEKEVKETYWDCFNVNKVVRGHWTKEDEFTVYLDDGHEQAEDIEKPKLNSKGQVTGVEVRRERGWYMSQVIIDKEDAERLREICMAKPELVGF